MARYLIDTDILIDHLRGFPPAHELLGRLVLEQHDLLISVITMIELISGAVEPGEDIRIQQLLSGIPSVQLNDEIAVTAALYRRKFIKKIKLGIADVIIAGTAKMMGAVLMTRNRKHFPMDDIRVHVPYSSDARAVIKVTRQKSS